MTLKSTSTLRFRPQFPCKRCGQKKKIKGWELKTGTVEQGRKRCGLSPVEKDDTKRWCMRRDGPTCMCGDCKSEDRDVKHYTLHHRDGDPWHNHLANLCNVYQSCNNRLFHAQRREKISTHIQSHASTLKRKKERDASAALPIAVKTETREGTIHDQLGPEIWQWIIQVVQEGREALKTLRAWQNGLPPHDLVQKAALLEFDVLIGALMNVWGLGESTCYGILRRRALNPVYGPLKPEDIDGRILLDFKEPSYYTMPLRDILKQHPWKGLYTIDPANLPASMRSIED